MAGFRILVCDGLDRAGLELLRAEPRVEVLERKGLSPDELLKEVADVHALLVRSRTRVTAGVLMAGRILKVVARPGAGLDNVDVEAAERLGIRVLNTPDAVTVSAAEHTMALLLSLARRVPQTASALKAGRWEKGAALGTELSGKTLGIVGYGRIGRSVAARAAAFGMRILLHDPAAPAESVPMDALLAASDVVTLHLPLLPSTEGLMGREAIARMKPGAFLVNCARGALVDEAALAAALRAGRLGGAALDVFREEPPAAGHPLLGLENVVATPHLGASTREAQARAARDAARQVLDFLLQGAVSSPAPR